jgi:hypothetical protein
MAALLPEGDEFAMIFWGLGYFFRNFWYSSKGFRESTPWRRRERPIHPTLDQEVQENR